MNDTDATATTNVSRLDTHLNEMDALSAATEASIRLSNILKAFAEGSKRISQWRERADRTTLETSHRQATRGTRFALDLSSTATTEEGERLRLDTRFHVDPKAVKAVREAKLKDFMSEFEDEKGDLEWVDAVAQNQLPDIESYVKQYGRESSVKVPGGDPEMFSILSLEEIQEIRDDLLSELQNPTVEAESEAGQTGGSASAAGLAVLSLMGAYAIARLARS